MNEIADFCAVMDDPHELPITKTVVVAATDKWGNVVHGITADIIDGKFKLNIPEYAGKHVPDGQLNFMFIAEPGTMLPPGKFIIESSCPTDRIELGELS